MTEVGIINFLLFISYILLGGYMKINYKQLIVFTLIPVALGALVGLLTSVNTNIDSIIPSWIFPVVWTILYILMGISSYLIFEKTGEISKIYIIQLIFNLLWSFIFFSFKWFNLAFIWIVILFYLVIKMIIQFIKTDKTAGLLQIPYAIWLVVAAILNLMKII